MRESLEPIGRALAGWYADSLEALAHAYAGNQDEAQAALDELLRLGDEAGEGQATFPSNWVIVLDLALTLRDRKGVARILPRLTDFDAYRINFAPCRGSR